MIKNYLDYFKYGFENLRNRRLRTWLTMIGIFIGIAAVVSLVSLGQGLQHEITNQFEMMGVDKIMIFPGTSLLGSMGIKGIELTDDDLDIIKKVKGVKLAGGWISKIAQVKYKDEVLYTYVSGIPQDESREIIESMQQMGIIDGRDLKESDKYKAVVGIMVSEGDVFDKPARVGDTVEIKGEEIKIVGVLSRIGNSGDDSQFLMPLDTAKILLDEDSYLMIIIQVGRGFSVSEVAENVKKELRKFRNVKEDEEDFTIQTMEQLQESYGSVITIVNAIIIGLAAISLVVGGVGIMNTMYTAVLQRTQEVGIMKAIGAKNKDILTLFLIESGMLGLAGGAIGIIIGMGISKSVELIAISANMGIIDVTFSPTLIIGALLFSFLVGTLSGTLPARQAAKMKPVDALRYE